MEMSLSKRLESEKFDLKNRKVLLAINFLDICLKSNIPEFAKFCVSNKDSRNSLTYRQCQIKLVKQEISNKKRKLRTLRRDATAVKNELSFKLISLIYIIPAIHIRLETIKLF